MSKSDWIKGLQQAEKDYEKYHFICGEHKDPDYLNDWILKSMQTDLDIDASHGFKCKEWCDGYSDFIWQKEHNRFDRGIK